MPGHPRRVYLLLHNPRCSKSRAALALLEERGVDVHVRDYIQEPLGLDELRILKKRLGRPVAEWFRWNEDAAKGLDRNTAEMALLQAMADEPRLMERPILIHGDHAVVGRPTEALEELL